MMRACTSRRRAARRSSPSAARASMSRPMVSNDSAKMIVTPHEQVHVRHHPLERVAQRQKRQRHVVLRDVQRRSRGLQVRHEVGVRQHHALRLPCRAGGVDDRREIVGLRPRGRSRNRAPHPTPQSSGAWPRSLTSSSVTTEGVSRGRRRVHARRLLPAPAAGAGFPESSRAAAAVETIARRAPESCRM